MGWQDIMQVCENGHQITARYEDSPHRRQSACDECGADTITGCPSCDETIDGKYHYDRVASMSTPDVPDHCSDCGEPFPWTSEGQEFSEVNPSVLDPELAGDCLSQYESGHYQSAVRTAFTVLEERIRDEAGLPQSLTGAKLATEAFNADGGPLAFGETTAEQEGTMMMYAGAFQTLRNPVSHRSVESIDEEYARDAIHTVNLMLRMMEDNAD